MLIDPQACEKARRSRDARFDGRFFVGVLTTGIYCRPVCPAPTPKRRNVRFFPTAAAAAEAGLRPCLRCRPESSPGTPAWLGTSETVSRALALIDSGFLDDGSVDELARRLDVTSRHLSRLFREHLGAPPVAVAQTRRLLFAKKLLNETDLAMADIAFAAGFGSVRRFNSVFQTTYGRPPSLLRRTGSPERVASTTPTSTEALVLELPYRPPFDWKSLIDFLAPRAIPGVESIGHESYRRTISDSGAPGTLEVRPRSDRPSLELRLCLSASRHLLSIVSRVRRLFDLGADPDQISLSLAADHLLEGPVRRHPGLRVPGAWDGFELAVRAILGQQVTVKGATTLSGRIVERFGTPLEATTVEGLEATFPTPERLADAELEAIGLPKTRAAAIRRLAGAVVDGVVGFEPSRGIEESVSRLTRLPGVGEWTAQYIAMRALGEPDAFPASDLGLRKAVSTASRIPTPTQLRSMAESWRPWRSYAAMYLWTDSRSLRPRRSTPRPSPPNTKNSTGEIE